MSVFFICLFIGISLSMDAFSLALIYGMYGLNFRSTVFLSIVVACFHFFMPLIGVFFGNAIMKYFIFNSDFIVGVIFLIIGVEMFFSYRNDEKVKDLSGFFQYLLFGFTVSIDSLTIGIGLSGITHHFFCASFLFMVLSGFFTFIGLYLGGRIRLLYGKYACCFGGIIMVVLSLYYIFFK